VQWNITFGTTVTRFEHKYSRHQNINFSYNKFTTSKSTKQKEFSFCEFVTEQDCKG